MKADHLVELHLFIHHGLIRYGNFKCVAATLQALCDSLPTAAQEMFTALTLRFTICKQGHLSVCEVERDTYLLPSPEKENAYCGMRIPTSSVADQVLHHSIKQQSACCRLTACTDQAIKFDITARLPWVICMEEVGDPSNIRSKTFCYEFSRALYFPLSEKQKHSPVQGYQLIDLSQSQNAHYTCCIRQSPTNTAFRYNDLDGTGIMLDKQKSASLSKMLEPKPSVLSAGFYVLESQAKAQSEHYLWLWDMLLEETGISLVQDPVSTLYEAHWADEHAFDEHTKSFTFGDAAAAAVDDSHASMATMYHEQISTSSDEDENALAAQACKPKGETQLESDDDTSLPARTFAIYCSGYSTSCCESDATRWVGCSKRTTGRERP